MRIVIQQVATVWTKLSRGGDGARTRNALPLAVPLPAALPQAAPWILHVATFCETNGFQQIDHCIGTQAFGELKMRDIEISTSNLQLQVRIFRDAWNAARPVVVPFEDLLIEPGRWARVCHNGRYIDLDTGNWWYEKQCYNIGWFDSYSADVFVVAPPAIQRMKLRRLR